MATLPSGQSESGEFGAGASNTLFEKQPTGSLEEAITFTVPLSAGIPESNIAYIETGKTTAECPGIGHAAKGFMCLYEAEVENMSSPQGYNGEEFSEHASGTGRFGVDLNWTTSSAALAYVDGTYTVTAP